MSLYNYENINYNSELNFFTVSLGATRTDIQSVLDTAPAGAIVQFAAGTFDLDGRLTITRDDLTVRGNSDEQGATILKFADTVTDDAFTVKGKLDTTSLQTLPEDVALGSKTLVLSDTSNLKAGDVLHVFQDNDEAFLSSGTYDLVLNQPYMKDCPLRESIVEIESIEGNVVTLKHAIAYDMTGGAAKVEVIDTLKNISISDLTLTYDLGPLDANTFVNGLPAFENHATMSVCYTDNIQLNGITLINTPSLGLEMRNSIDANVTYLTVDGAYNKGGDGNGYGLHISGTSNSNFEHLNITDVRHAVIFSSWNAEAWNTVQVDFTNRDINYHGSPDHSNTVIVNESIYSEGNQAWALVSPGNAYMHPYTDISQNTNLFGHAVGGSKDDTVFGWDNGSVLAGNGGDDKLTGGALQDLISGGDGNDTLAGRGGPDVFVYQAGDDNDVITDFEVGESGDVLMVSGFAGVHSLADVKIEQVGADAKLTFLSSATASDTILLKNVDMTALTGTNFSFTALETPVALNQVLSAGADWVKNVGVSDDVVSTKFSFLGADDVIALGGGNDTLKIDTLSFTFDTGLYANISGVDMIDVTSATSAKLMVSQSFLDRTDADSLKLVYGASGIERLATAGLQSDSKVYLSGNGTVRLADNLNNVVTITTDTLGSVVGARGNDTFKIESLGKVTLDGGAGNDTFTVNVNQLNGQAIIKGGDGVDELIVSGATKLTATAMANISGIEKISFTTTGADVQLTDTMMGGRVEFAATGTDLLSEKVRINTLTSAATMVVGNNVSLTLSGTSALTHTVIVKDGVNGTVKGSLGADILIGGTGNDCLKGLDGNDDINGGAGKDSLYGGVGRDTFRFVRGEAMDTVGDFEAGVGGDVVNLASYYQFTSFADVAAALSQKDATTVRLTLSPTEYITFKNQSVANFTADNFVIDNSKVLNLTLQTTAGVDKLVAVAGTDAVDINGATLGSGDYIDLGTGADSLRLVGAVNQVDGTLSTIKGVEVIDATAATTATRILVTDDMVASNGTGALTIKIGAAGLQSLATSLVSDLRAVVLQGNNTSVTLADGVNNKVTLDPMVNVTVAGGTGADSFKIRGGDVTVNGQDGNDSFTVTASTALKLDGGNGDDVFMLNNVGFVKGQTIIGGAGFDEVRLYQADVLTVADLQHISGIEKLTLGAGTSTLELDTTLFDSSLTLKSSSGVAEVYIDATRLDVAHKLIIDSGIIAHINGEIGDNYVIETTSKANQPLYGSAANETMTGGTAADTFYGADGNDTLSGGYGKDILLGGNGDDILVGGRDMDTLTGGTGNDVFVYRDKYEGGDTVTDFGTVLDNQDKLDLTTLFDVNGLGAEDFASAVAKSMLVLQQSGSDVLVSFDRDGVKSGVATLMVTLQNVDVHDLNASNVIL